MIERSVTSDQVIQRLRPKVAAVQGLKFFMQSGQDISVGGRLSRTQYQYTLTDTDSSELNHWAPIVEAAMQKLPQLQDVASDQQIAAPHMAIEIDRDAAARLGVSTSLIDETLYDAFGQRQIATMYTSTNQYKVILEVKPEFQDDPTALSKIYVTGPNGTQVPLSSFAHFTSKIEPLSVNHQGQFPAVTLSFNLAPGVALGAGGRPDPGAVSASCACRRPSTAPSRARRRRSRPRCHRRRCLSPPRSSSSTSCWACSMRATSTRSRSCRPLPSAGVGALLALMSASHYDLTVIAMIGVILLIGIVKKNAIMMIDFALQAERLEGKSPLEAIHEACLLRFRPIMMTTFAALFGAIADRDRGGAGSELRRPLGIAIVGGLLVSQWLTLYTTPVIYLYLDRLAAGSAAARGPSRIAEALADAPRPALAEDPPWRRMTSCRIASSGRAQPRRVRRQPARCRGIAAEFGALRARRRAADPAPVRAPRAADRAADHPSAGARVCSTSPRNEGREPGRGRDAARHRADRAGAHARQAARGGPGRAPAASDRPARAHVVADAARLDGRRPDPGDQRADPRGGLCRAEPRDARGPAANTRPPQIQPPAGRRERDRSSRVAAARFSICPAEQTRGCALCQ